MSLRHVGLTAAIAAALHEAARVCLDRHHQPPAEITIRRAGNGLMSVADWLPTDDRTRAAWANLIDTTESGAYACALAAVELVGGMVAVRRAETLTGADYYLAPADQLQDDDLERSIRLEVSGSDGGNQATLERRLREKVDQALAGASNLPAMAGVVGFREKVILLSQMVSP